MNYKLIILSILYWFSLQIIEYHESKSINSSFIQDSHKCTVLWLKLIFEPIKGEVLTNKAFPENLITLLPFLMFLNLSLEYVNIYNFILLHFLFFGSTSSSNCYYLTCIQISQEAGQVVWYSHLLMTFPQFIVTYTVKGFGIVNKAGVDVILLLSCFLMIQWMLAIGSLVPLPFLKPGWTSGSSWFMYCWSLACRILSITLLVCGLPW